MKPKVHLPYYFKMQLKSTEKCPKFYSPSLNTTTVDADGGQVISFGDSNQDDKRPRPNGIFVPPMPIEECPPIAFINCNDESVANGAPRFLTEKQHTLASNRKTAAPADDSEHATA